MPGISAVSPPISAHPACSQPVAMPRDHVGRDVDVELPAGEVVEEEQRLGTLDQDVVDAHRDQIDADRVVPVERERQHELGADAVGPGDEHRIAEALADLDQSAEAADAGQHLGAQRTLGERLDPLDQRVAGGDVDAGIAIGQTGAGVGREHDAESVVARREEASGARTARANAARCDETTTIRICPRPLQAPAGIA